MVLTNSPYSYSSFYAGELNLFAWEGRNVVVLSRSNNLNNAVMIKMLEALDKAYDFYASCTGRVPVNCYCVNNKLSIADVPFSCGPGCGMPGATGIELTNDTFDTLYAAIATSNEYDQTIFYEFGRNFWFYKNQYLDDPIAKGYAIFMRFMSMDSIPVVGAPWNNYPFSTLKSSIENLVDLYLPDQRFNWANTIGQNCGVPNNLNLDASDLFASFCFSIQYKYPTFVNLVWKESESLKHANSPQEAVDNFFIASCKATHTNLTSMFDTWRCRISIHVLNDVGLYTS